MSIGVIAFAFVSLFALLPAGLTTFREAIDNSNETRIVQSLSGKLQVTDFQEIPQLDYATSAETYYFDEEGTPTDTSKKPATGREAQRLYAAKLFVRDAASKDSDDPTRPLNFSVNVLVVFANLASPGAKQLDSVASLEQLEQLSAGKGRVHLRVRPILISKMDAIRL